MAAAGPSVATPQPAQPAPTWLIQLFAALTAFATAAITLLTVFNTFHWTKAQTALVATEAGAVIALITALTLHMRHETKNEPVTLAATLTAAVSATLALGTGFKWWHWTPSQISAVVAVVTAIVGIGTALIARAVVTPNHGPS